MALKRGIESAVDAVVEELKKISSSVENSDKIAQVGTISSNGDATIGNIIAEAMQKVGKNGVITIKESKTMSTELSTVDGMQFDRAGLLKLKEENAKTDLNKDRLLNKAHFRP
jgi:chaperonin GroEL